MQEQNDHREKEVELSVQELVQRGLVETYYNEHGEKTARLTNKGKVFAQELVAHKYN